METIIGNKYLYLPTCASTNDYAKHLLKDSLAVDGSIIRTGEQTKGRGYHTNTWESEKDKNFLFSILLLPTWLKPENQFMLSKAVSLGILKYLKRYKKGFTIKWPNDIYYQDKKIAGILIENSIQGNSVSSAIIGIGININQQEFKSKAPNPISLNQITDLHFELDSELKILSDCLNKYYNLLRSGSTAEIDKQYLRNLFGLNEMRKYSADDEMFNAKVHAIGPYGTLLLQTESGEVREFGFKEVSFIA